MAVPCTIIMAATVLTALMPPIYCLEETREPSRDPRRHRENMLTPRRDLPIVNSSSIPLNMVHDAVDDKYEGCDKKMKKVEKKYFKKENKGTFKEAWKECSKKKYPQNKDLTKNHMLAICVYTSSYKNNPNDKKLYVEFNEAVRTNRSIYGSSFRFHYLHFWLTTAIQKLKKKQTGCHTTYRRTTVTFTGKVDHIIRFGMFASSSFRKDLDDFGKKSCFKIETCSGADLGNYANLGTEEEEVLIPPYETFKITKIFKGRGKFKDLKDCENVFVLKSEKKDESNLNCKLVNK